MKRRILTAVFVAIFLFACKREAPPAAATATAGETASTVIIPQDATKSDVDVRVPITAGTVAKCNAQKTTYRRNESVVLTLDMTEAPEGLQVAARILDKNERLVARVSEPASGRKSVTLTIKDKVPAGNYKLEGLWGGNIVCEHPIVIGR